MSGTPVDYVNSTDVQYLSADIELVSEHGRRHLRSSSHRTLAVPRTRRLLLSATEVLLSQDRVCGTVYRLL